MFWWIVTPFAAFGCVVLAIFGTLALIRISPSDPGEVEHE